MMPSRIFIIAFMQIMVLFPAAMEPLALDHPPEPAHGIKKDHESAPSRPANEEEQLATRKVLVTGRSFRQIFEPYLQSKKPVFITSDAVLGAFHTLFKESLFRIEKRNARLFPDILKLIWERILLEEKKADRKYRGKHDFLKPGPGQNKPPTDIVEIRRQAILRIKIILAIALKLSGDEHIKIDKKLKWIVNREVNRIIKAEGFKMPTWIGNSTNPTDRMDYSHFKPEGFYAQTDSLKRYYRVLRLFQSVPFRMDRDQELLGILILGRIIGNPRGNDFKGRHHIETFFKAHAEFFGQNEDRDILLAAQISRDRPKNLNQVRQYVTKRSLDLKNALKIKDAESLKIIEHLSRRTRHFYIIYPDYLMDAFVFKLHWRPGHSPDRPDNGLLICSLLGSKYAGENLMIRSARKKSRQGQTYIQTVKQAFGSKNIYRQYLYCLEALLDTPEPDAPDFMKEKNWAKKNCNTVLFGWSRFRHTWQAHESPMASGDHAVEMDNPLPGFVEPEPEFYARLGEYAEETKRFLVHNYGFETPKDAVTRYLRSFSALVADKTFPDEIKTGEPGSEESNAISKAISCLAAVGNIRYHEEDYLSRRKEIILKINSFARDIEHGKYDNDPNFEAFVLQTNLDLNHLWDQFSDICRKLEVIAHKQLRAVGFNQKEKYFLTDFGEKLAGVMLHGENTYKRPEDNSPSVTEVYHDPEKKLHLLAATGRPRELLVLYPYQGREVVCRGVIVPYYDLVLPGPITDRQWKKVLDSDERPDNPPWFKTLEADSKP